MAPRRLLPVDYIGHDPSLLSKALPFDDQVDPIVRCLLSRASTIADPKRFSSNFLWDIAAKKKIRTA